MKEIAAQQLVVLTQALSLEGINVQPLLKQWGLVSSAQAPMRPWRSAIELDELMLLCQHLSGDPGFGLVVATSHAQMCHGTLAILALHAPTLRATLDDLTRYYPIVQDQQELNYTVAEGRCTVGFSPLGVSPGAIRFRAEQIMGGLLALLRFCGLEDEDLLNVRLMHPRPPYVQRYESAFGAHFAFNQTNYSLQFRAHLLDAPRIHSDGQAYAMARATANLELDAASHRRSIVEVVRSVIRASGAEWIGMKAAALQLRMSERTLRRQLAEAGTSFVDVFDSMRVQEAKKLIALEAMPLKQVAAHAGYESVSNFNRAFKRKTGLTPLQWRVQQAQPGNGAPS